MRINPTTDPHVRPMKISDLIDQCRVAARGMSANNNNRNLLMNVAAAMEQLTERLAEIEDKQGAAKEVVQ